MGAVPLACCASGDGRAIKEALRSSRTGKVKNLPGPANTLREVLGDRFFLPTDPCYHMARGDPDEGPRVRWDAFESEGSFRQTWNVDCLGFPCAIAMPATAAEVQKVVAYASQHCLQQGVHLCVAGGRHSHQCMLDDTFVLDLQKLNSVVIDKEKRTAKVGGGAIQGELDMACEPFGLATTAGHNASTGCGGLVLQGGHGFLERKFGLVVDNLLEAEVVLADGRFATANDTSDADLFWALKGGGGNFGVVVSFTFQLHPLSIVWAGQRVHVPAWPFGKDRDALLMDFYEKTVKGPNEATGLAVMPGGGPFVEILLWAGDPSEGEAYFTSKNSGTTPLLKNSMGIHSYHKDVQRFYEPGNINPHYQVGVLLPELTQEAATKLAELVVGSCAPNDMSAVIILPLGGQMGVPASIATANPHRHYKCWVLISGSWPPNSSEEVRSKCVEWVRKVKAAMQPFSEGASYGVLGEVKEHDNQEGRRDLANEGGAVGAFVGKRNVYGENLPRLQKLKKVYDPQNLFRLNDNITPA